MPRIAAFATGVSLLFMGAIPITATATAASAASATGAAGDSRAAAELSADVVLTDITRTVPGTARTQFDVTAGSPRGIAGMRVTVSAYYKYGDEIGFVNDFSLVDGTPEGGTWRSESSLALERKNYRVHVEIWDSDLVEYTFDRFIMSAPTPELRDYGMGPTTVYPDQLVTYQGRFVVRAEDGSEQPAAGVKVQHKCAHGGVGGHSITDAEGRFSDAILTDHSTRCHVFAVTDGNYTGIDSPTTDIKFVSLPTRLTGALSPGASLTVGRHTTLSGRLERRSEAGEWAGLRGAVVEFTFKAAETGAESVIGKAAAEADGSFTASLLVTGSGTLTGAFTGFGDGSGMHGYLPSSSSVGQIRASFDTAFNGLTAPPLVGKGAQFTIDGQLTRRTETGARVAVTGGSVDLEFSPDYRLTWKTAGSVRTDGQGNFSIPVRATADGYWRVRYRGHSPGSNSSEHTPDLPVIGDIGTVDVRYRTTISSFNAAPEPVVKGRTLTVSGVLKRAVDGSTFKIWPGRAVHVYYQAAGSKVWTYAGSTKTNKYGKFVKGFKASKDATWKAVYKGDAGHLRAESATDYVDVR